MQTNLQQIQKVQVATNLQHIHIKLLNLLKWLNLHTVNNVNVHDRLSEASPKIGVKVTELQPNDQKLNLPQRNKESGVQYDKIRKPTHKNSKNNTKNNDKNSGSQQNLITKFFNTNSSSVSKIYNTLPQSKIGPKTVVMQKL